jgi:hypothetical protein
MMKVMVMSCYLTSVVVEFSLQCYRYVYLDQHCSLCKTEGKTSVVADYLPDPSIHI